MEIVSERDIIRSTSGKYCCLFCFFVSKLIRRVIMKSSFSHMTALALTMWLCLAGVANAGSHGGGSQGQGGGSQGQGFGSFGGGSHGGDSQGFGSFGGGSHGGDSQGFGSFGGDSQGFGSFGGDSQGFGSFSGDSQGGGSQGGGSQGGGSGGGSNNYPISPVPEPQTYAMLLIGLGLVGFSARRRVKNA
jgi:hypothetical protein